MGAYNFPFPTRRRSARTPPFVPSPRVTQLPSPPPLPENSPQQTSAPPQAGNPPGIGRRVVDFLTNPDMGTYFAGVSNRLLAPRQFGETATGQIMGGLLGGFNDLAAKRQMMYQAELQQREMARKAGLEEREMGVKEAEQISKQDERQIDASIKGRQATAQETTAEAARMRAETDIKRQAAEDKNKAAEIAAQAEHWRGLEKKAMEDVRVAEIRAKNYAERTKAMEARETNRAAREARQDKIASGNLAVAQAKVKLEEAKDKREAAEKGDSQLLKKLELAYDQAAKEMEAEAKVYAAGEDPSAMTTRIKSRVQEILGQLDASLAKPSTSSTAPSSTPTRIKVRLKDGREGTIDSSEFDPKTMTKVP